MNNDTISIIVAIISAFVALVTLISTIVIGIMQIKQNLKMDEQNKRIDKRDEDRRKNMIYAKATKFILKYNSPNFNSEIDLLPLCIIGYKYNPLYSYRREIYREFCSLTEEIQNCILERQNIDIKSYKCDNFYNEMLEALLLIIKKKYPKDRELYYDNGKYFKRALLYHGKEKIPDIKCDHDKYSINNFNDNAPKMDYEKHITNLLNDEEIDMPVDLLMDEPTSIGKPIDDKEILISYLSCIMAKYIPYYSQDDCNYQNIGCIESYEGTKYMEDLFLDALYNIFMYQRKLIENDKI